MNYFLAVGVAVVALLGTEVKAQGRVAEDTIIVKGICNMCKERIEEAAYGKGVKYATWNKETDELSISYRKDKTSLEDIENRIVKAGHSTGSKQAQREDYESLPDCCRYETQHKH